MDILFLILICWAFLNVAAGGTIYEPRKVWGVDLVLCSFERSLWWDHDRRAYNPSGFGIKLSLLAGKMIRPVPKFWRLGFWRGENAYNPWKGGEYWFIVRIPLLVAPFISIAIGAWGIYLGCKTFEIEPEHEVTARYGKWLRKGEAGTDAEPAVYMQLTATMRRTRWK